MMKYTRGALFAAALLAGVALTGCGGTTTTEEPAAKPVDPKAAIAKSVDGLKEGNYAYNAKTPDTDSTGAIHLPTKSASMVVNTKSADGDGKIEIRMIDPDRWMKITMDTSTFEGLEDIDTSDPQMAKLAAQMQQLADLFSGKNWMHVDQTKLKGEMAKDLAVDASNGDITGLTALIGTVVTAEGDAKTIKGTLDATKVTEDSGMVTLDDVKAMGAGASALPYTATLDDQGRITSLELDAPKAGEVPAGKWTINVTGYGEQKAQEKPTGSVKEMPTSAYDMLNG
jgi:hypothetical protein